ncbi:hypothetical protein A2U01_0030361, partial [Trifolium medium]|nr:hypothetical protein [Trifolium medium]
ENLSSIPGRNNSWSDFPNLAAELWITGGLFPCGSPSPESQRANAKYRPQFKGNTAGPQ